MSGIDEVVGLIQKQGEEFSRRFAELDQMRRDIDAVAERAGRPGMIDAKPKPALETWIDAKTRQAIPVLGAGDSLAALEAKPENEIKSSVGRVLRGLIVGGTAPDAKELAEERKAMGITPDPDGGYTVSGLLSAQWIDLLRRRMVLTQAGARTLPMEAGSVSIARVDADPSVSWHGENAALSAAQPTLGQVNLRARTVVCLVKMSLELSQDSANIETILQNVITGALAVEIDRAGLLGSTADGAAAPWGLLNQAGINAVTSVGTPADYDKFVDAMYELLADNVPEDRIGALVGHPKLWKAFAKLKTGITSDKTILVAPSAFAKLPKLYTTGCPEAKAVIADWTDLLFGVRKGITVRVLQESFMGSNLQIGVLAYARCDFVATREQSFVALEGITY